MVLVSYRAGFGGPAPDALLHPALPSAYLIPRSLAIRASNALGRCDLSETL